MRIRQIELVGFKSFREPTRLALAAGINAVVGPNGCGKSNVVDAIRWALGEQSVKHLRAKDMEDVIFSGNARSAPLNFAEVSLVFEQQGEDALEFAGEAEGLAAHVARQHEFTITRRIYRSGESQYLINQSPARLRDITELFLGSGVGPKAYAIIEQGRVGQIVAAKPEDLRLFVEEAAGTTRFRSRKIAAERKLERTSENLARVNDVMREIDRQLATLRRQAKRAEEYRVLAAELVATEVALAGFRWRSIASEHETARADLEQARGVASAAERELEAAEISRREAAEREHAAAQDIESAFTAVAEVSAAAVRATERQASAAQYVSSLEARIGRAAGEIAALDAGAGESERLLAEATEARDRWQGAEAREVDALTAADREVESLSPAFDELRGETSAAVTALDAARRAAAEAAAGQAESATRLQGLREESERVRARLAERHAEIESTAARQAEAEGALGTSRHAHDRLEGSRREATADLRSREEEQRRLEETLAAVREVLVHRRGLLEGLRERERAFDGYADGLAGIMSGDPRPLGLVLDGLVIPPELEPAVAAVLGDALRGAVVAEPEDAAAIARRLRETSAGRITLVPASATGATVAAGLPPGARPLGELVGVAPGSEGARAALFDGVVLVDDLATAVAAWRAGGGASNWVTRAGDLLDRHGIVTGGQVPETADLLQRRREVGELAAQIAEDEVRQGEIERRLADVRDECARLGAELRRLDTEAHAATLALVAAEHSLDTARRDIGAARSRAADTEQEFAAVARAVSSAEAGLAEVQERLRAAAAAETGAIALVADLEAKLATRRVELDAARRERESRREALSAAREALTRAAADLGRREHERDVARTNRARIEDEMGSLERDREATRSLLESLEAELATRRAELVEREDAVARARGRAQAVQEELRGHEATLSRTRGTLEEARVVCQRIELRLAQQAAQLESLATFAREQHGLDPAGVEVPTDFDEPGAATRIQAVKERIERLGDVNVAAIADARELEERFGFLDGQRRDLEASIEDLRQTIAELSRTTRTRFRDTFELANQRFGEFFAELFRGGRACLKLTQPANLLETGVEMEVQPPGKAVRALELLSGGEKALTAISLLMALFSLRATPFCVLDEVDAPLDEANLGRFNAMISRMSDRTQFVVITHKQPTMESADALFGVTMAEAGVSQLVSVAMPGREETPEAGVAIAASA